MAPPLNTGHGFEGLHWTSPCPNSFLRSIWGKPTFRVNQICPLSQADRNLLLMPIKLVALSKDRVAFSAHCRSSDLHWAHIVCLNLTCKASAGLPSLCFSFSTAQTKSLQTLSQLKTWSSTSFSDLDSHLFTLGLGCFSYKMIYLFLIVFFLKF